MTRETTQAVALEAGAGAAPVQIGLHEDTAGRRWFVVALPDTASGGFVKETREDGIGGAGVLVLPWL